MSFNKHDCLLRYLAIGHRLFMNSSPRHLQTDEIDNMLLLREDCSDKHSSQWFLLVSDFASFALE